jgi:membrane-associated protease RseP (regulator of RpoE activity)
MRRLHALLAAAGLLAAPASAAAGPGATKDPRNDTKSDSRSDSTPDTNPDNPWTETFEWSMSTGRARLGVAAIGITPELRRHLGAPEDRGVLIGRVEPGSPAAAAGLAVGDVLTEVGGEAVDSAPDVLSALAGVKKDEAVALAVIRDRRPLALSAKLLDDPAPRAMRGAPWTPWLQGWFRSFPPFPPFPSLPPFPSDPRTHRPGGPDKTST